MNTQVIIWASASVSYHIQNLLCKLFPSPRVSPFGDTWIEKHTFGFGSHIMNENQPFENPPKGNETYQWWFLVVEV